MFLNEGWFTVFMLLNVTRCKFFASNITQNLKLMVLCK